LCRRTVGRGRRNHRRYGFLLCSGHDFLLLFGGPAGWRPVTTSELAGRPHALGILGKSLVNVQARGRVFEHAGGSPESPQARRLTLGFAQAAARVVGFATVAVGTREKALAGLRTGTYCKGGASVCSFSLPVISRNRKGSILSAVQ